MSPNREALRRARELRDEYRARPEGFNHHDYLAALPDKLRDLEPAFFDGYVAHVAKTIDEEAHRDDDGDMQGLFPGWGLDGEFRLGEGRRIARRLARLHHVEESLAIDEENLAAVMAASAKKHQRIAKLRPYWRPEMTFQEVVEAAVADGQKP